MKRDRLLLIGQSPSINGDPRRPLIAGPTGERLRELLGLDLLAYVRATERVNLLAEYPGKAGKGDRFPLEEAREAAVEMTPRLLGRRVIFVGHGVARAFGLKGRPLVWHERAITISQLGVRGAIIGEISGWHQWAICPHPTGINRWWNDPKNKAKALAFFGGLRP